MKIELVVFDVAGTTVNDDGAVAAALHQAARDFGVDPAPAEVDHVMGLAKPEALAALLGGRAPEGHVQQAHAAFTHYMLEHYRRAPSVRPIQGAAATFSRLREMGVKIALDTGFDRTILDAVLLRLGWKDEVDATVASDEVPRGRPAPLMIRRAMDLTGVRDPLRVAKVGDTPSDMREGIEARCGLVIGVLTGTGSAAELRGAGATHVIPSVASLPRLWVGAAA